MRQLKAWATQMATTNLFAHSGSQLYGENLYGQFGAGPLNSIASFSTLESTCVSSWYSEISMYNFNSPGYSDATGHYTQVVWKSTTMLGMGLGWGIKSGGVNSYYCVSQYSPPGNNVMPGQFLANVLPPLSSTTTTLQSTLSSSTKLPTSTLTTTIASTPSNPCISSPCQNGGICTAPSSTSFACTCIQGYTGSLCQTQINYCASTPCQNGATCVKSLSGYTCVCLPSFTGQNCQSQVSL